MVTNEIEAKLKLLDKDELLVLYEICHNDRITAGKIAENIHFSESTVRQRLTSLYTKLGIRHQDFKAGTTQQRVFLVNEFCPTFKALFPTQKSIEELPSTTHLDGETIIFWGHTEDEWKRLIRILKAAEDESGQQSSPDESKKIEDKPLTPVTPPKPTRHESEQSPSIEPDLSKPAGEEEAEEVLIHQPNDQAKPREGYLDAYKNPPRRIDFTPPGSSPPRPPTGENTLEGLTQPPAPRRAAVPIERRQIEFPFQTFITIGIFIGIFIVAFILNSLDERTTSSLPTQSSIPTRTRVPATRSPTRTMNPNLILALTQTLSKPTSTPFPLPFEDEFDKNLDNWNIIYKGAYVQDGYLQSNRETAVEIGNEGWTNYQVTLKIAYSCQGQTYIGLRSRGVSEFIRFDFCNGELGQKNPKGSYDEISSKPVELFTNFQPEWKTVRFYLSGSKLTINGDFLFKTEISLPPYALNSGGVILYINKGDRIDSIRIDPLDDAFTLPTATPLPKVTLPFVDNFSQSMNPAWIISGDPEKLYIEDGILKVRQSGALGSFTGISLREENWGNFLLEMRIGYSYNFPPYFRIGGCEFKEAERPGFISWYCSNPKESKLSYIISYNGDKWTTISIRAIKTDLSHYDMTVTSDDFRSIDGMDTYELPMANVAGIYIFLNNFTPLDYVRIQPLE